MTLPTLLVLRAMLAEPTREMYGLEICKAAELPSGTIHPVLARLERYGWLESCWENIEPAEEGRPRRRYYRLSTEGADRARAALERIHIPVPAAGRAPKSRLIPRLTGGAS
jgi:PadR family transcriptional regulator, regulatory protein PadR